MKNLLSNKKVGKILSIIFVPLFILILIGSAVANSFAVSINSYLGCETYKIVESDHGEDTEYFKSAWDSMEEFDAFSREICEQVEAEGAVLLMNENNALPISEGGKVSCFSHSSVDIIYGGTGSGSVDTSTAPTLKDALFDAGLEVNETLWNFYLEGVGSEYMRSVTDIDGSATKGEYKINEVPWSAYTRDAVSSVAAYGDAAIVVIARCGGEGGDLWRSGTDGEGGDYLSLSQEEKDMLSQVGAMKQNGTIKKVVVLLNASNALNCDFLKNQEYGIDACLWIGGVGQYGLNSVARILTGKENPSGALVDTFCYDNMTAPAMQNFGDYVFTNAAEMGLEDDNPVKQVNDSYVVYQEGIYVGYKYYETRHEDAVMGQGNTKGYDYHADVAFPFGYGLSYTEFTYGDYTVEENEEDYTVEVTVTNTGNTAGKKIVQVYLQKPYTEYDVENKVEKAAVELVGFGKTGEIEPGASETVEILVPKYLMRTYDSVKAKSYIVEEGTYYLAVSDSAHDAVNKILSAKGYDADAKMSRTDAYEFEVDEEQAKDLTELASTGATGTKITNHFDDTDLNTYENYEGKITYLSRSDWTNTWPQPVSITLTEAMAKDIVNEFETESGYEMPKYEQMNEIMLANMIGREYDDPDWELLLDQMSFDEQVTLITNSFHNTKVVTSIQKPATKETNGPQGITDSFINGNSSGMAFPAEVIMAATWNTELMEDIGECIGEQGLKSRTHGVYGPAANIHRTAYSGRNYEYFSEDGFLSGAMAAPEVAAIEDKGVYVLLKHFALNDQETNRAGVTTWGNEQAIREIYLTAFEIPTVEANVHGYMTVMNRIGAAWGGAHAGLLNDVARGEWGFKGYVITDCTVNSTYTDSLVGLQGGSDIWDGVNSIELTDESLYEYQNDPYVCQLMRQAVHRLLYVQANSSAMNGLSQFDRVVELTTWWQKLLIGLQVGFGLLALSGVLIFINAKRKEKKS